MRKIGVVIPGVVQVDYLGEVYRGIADTAKENRYSLLTSIQNVRRQDDMSHFWGRDGCEGAVLVVPYNCEQIIERCRENKCDCVLVDYDGDQYAQLYPTVEAKNSEGIEQSVEHLLELGHRRIGFITGALHNASAQQRLQGYRQALAAAGIAVDPALIVEGSWTPPENYTAARALLQLDSPPTALVTSCDIAAFAAYRVARELGLEVGRDISITGFDDMRTASTSSPPLTTVRQQIYRLGQVAVEMLIQRLNGVPLPEMHVRLDTELIVRQSTGRTPTNPSADN